MAKSKYIDRDNMYSDRMDADSGGEDFMGGLPAEVGGAMAGGQGTGLAESLAQPLGGAIAGTATGVAGLPSVAPAAAAGAGSGLAGLPGTTKKPTSGISQTQEEGMVPIYSQPVYETRGHGNQVLVDQGGKFLGYQKPEATPAGGKIETPKPPEILAKEKELGHELEPIYAMGAVQHGSGTSQPVEYGEPIGYRYDNGKSEYVNFDTSGQQTSIRERSNLGTLIRDLAPLALTAVGANFLAPMLAGGAGAAGAAGTAAAAPLAFTPEMIAAGAATPGSIGALGAASGALTGAELAAAGGVGSLGAGALTGAAGAGGYGSGAANPSLLGSTGAGGAGEAGITTLSKVLPSVNEMIASGTFTPGAAGALNAGALTAEQLAAATGVSGAGVTSLAPAAAKSINEMVASGMSPGSAGAAGAASGALTPAQLAAASGVVTTGATPALVELGRAGKALPSVNEMVASGLGPGSAGAAGAAQGALTAEELAAAAGTAGAVKNGVGDLLTKAKDAITDKAKDALSGSSSGVGSGMGILGLMALMSMMNKGGGAAPASTATIPELTANRTQLPYDVDKKGVNPNTPYRPGQGGVNYFSPTTYTPTPPKAAGGGLMSLGQSNLGSYSDGGRLLQGPGDGVSDSIPAIIGRKQPARLANGEFVIPARIVSELGNGSTDAGAKRLYEMMDRVQSVRRKTKNVAANTKASKYLPA